MAPSRMDDFGPGSINTSNDAIHVPFQRQDLRISPGSAFERAGSSRNFDVFPLKMTPGEEQFSVRKVHEDWTHKDLHPLLQKSQWKKLSEALKILQDSATSDPKLPWNALTAKNRLGETPVHVASYKAPSRLALSMLEMVPAKGRKQYLLRLDDDGNTPLHLACGNLDSKLEFSFIKNILLLAPEALEVPNKHGDTPLHMLVASEGFKRSADFAVEAAAEEAIASLVMMVGKVAVMQNANGCTLLHIAIGNGCHERVLVKLLSLAPQAARVADQRGMLPIHYVAAFGGTPWTFVGQLIWAFPEGIVAQTEAGDTPLHLLMSNASKHVKADRFLDRNTTKLAELLVGSGAEDVCPVMVQNSEKMSPLHCCALFDTPPQLTKILMNSHLARSASALTTEFGATALHLVCASSSVSDSVANLEALATPEACAIMDGNDRTPLMVAVENKRASVTVIKALLSSYPEAAKQATSRGFLPLHLALQSSSVKDSIVKALMKAYPESVRAKTKNGNTALHEACRYGAPVAVVSMILSKNRNAMEEINNNGESPLDLAQAHNAAKEVIALLDGTLVVFRGKLEPNYDDDIFSSISTGSNKFDI